jgi:hypothetical protein
VVSAEGLKRVAAEGDPRLWPWRRVVEGKVGRVFSAEGLGEPWRAVHLHGEDGEELCDATAWSNTASRSMLAPPLPVVFPLTTPFAGDALPPPTAQTALPAPAEAGSTEERSCDRSPDRCAAGLLLAERAAADGIGEGEGGGGGDDASREGCAGGSGGAGERGAGGGASASGMACLG